MPEDFYYNHELRQFVDPSTKPELSCGSVEYIASVEYMVRPPQPAAYLFVFDCSCHATQLGYIPVFARAVLESLDEIPGDARTLIGFIAFDSKLHFFNLGEKQPVHLVLPDIQGLLNFQITFSVTFQDLIILFSLQMYFFRQPTIF